MAQVVSNNFSLKESNQTLTDTGKSFSTRYNDPSKWSAERKLQQENNAKISHIFSFSVK